MRCVVSGNFVKLFAKAIHCLAKIGDEIYLEPLSKGLSLRTVNSSRSAYASFLFLTDFFQNYNDDSRQFSQTTESPTEDALKCKLSVKSFLSVFKSLSTIERLVDRCAIKMDTNEATLTFLLYCRHGITKTYNLTYQDCESLQAVFTKDLCPNVITAQPRIFNEVVVNFQNNQEEITLTVCPQQMKVTNYVDDEPDPDRVIHTEMILVQEEFDNYQIGVDTEITFCLKELKGILTFAESSGQPLDIHFEHGGKPIVFSLTSDPTFEANFVLATLIDQPQSSQQTQPSSSRQKTQTNTHKIKKNDSKTTNITSIQQDFADDEFNLGEDWGENSLVEMMDVEIAKEVEKNEKKQRKNNANNLEGKSNDDLEDFFPESLSESATLSHKLNELPSLGDFKADSSKSPGIMVRSGRDRKKEVKVMNEEELLEESIPGTPPSKKFKSMFFSAMENSETLTQNTDSETTTVLAVDTDEESE